MNKIFLAGHNGMVGSAILKLINQQPKTKVITKDRSKLDLMNQTDVYSFFKKEKFDEVYMCAAKVGGIYANETYPADFIYENLSVQNNIINASHETNVQKLLFLGSSCIYPKLASQPMNESTLLTGKLEPTNEPYAIAKIAGIKMCEAYNRQHKRDYRSVMPTNLYGPNDNFHPKNSHVIPALINKFHNAMVSNSKSVTLWGSGTPKREFLHVDDMASASVHIMNLSQAKYQSATNEYHSHINIGSGVDHSIKELAELIAEITNFKGDLVFDTSQPDGTPRKLLDISVLKSCGWSPKIDFKEGLEATYDWYKNNANVVRRA